VRVKPEGVNADIEGRLEGIRFEPRESLGPEIMGRVRRGERSLSDVRPRWLLPWGLAAAALLTGVLVLRDVMHRPELAVVDTCCSSLDGGDHNDDGARVYLDARGEIRRIEVYEDRDGSGGFSPGDVIRLVRGPAPVLLEDGRGPVVAMRHCCADLDGEGPGDDGLLVVSRPGEDVVLAAVYEAGSSRPLR
jgi:hypothetical protein